MAGSDIGTSSGTDKGILARAFQAAKLLTEDERRKVLRDKWRTVLTGRGDGWSLTPTIRLLALSEI